MTQLISPTEVAVAKKEAALSTPLAHQARDLEITDADSYAIADQILTKIVMARKAIEERIDHILKPLNEARSSILALRRELDGPPGQAEDAIRNKMRIFRLNEAQLQLQQKRKLLQEQEELRQRALDAQKKADAAKTIQMKSRLADRALALEAQVAQKEMERPTEPVKVAGSTFRPVKRAVVTDMKAFVAAVAAGKIPIDTIELRQSAINKYFRDAAPVVMSWPGVVIEDDVTIARR